jgi:ketosteroid isomerase-like protein
VSENLDLVQAVFDAYFRGDEPALLALAAADIVASVTLWEDAKIARITNYGDIDEARATAERLAEERG